MKQQKQTASNTFQILESMKRQYAANPTQLGKLTIENLERTAHSLMDVEMGAKLKNFESKHHGADWWEVMEKNYPVTYNEERKAWVVTSNVRVWKEPKDWECVYKFDALQKVRQLVLWVNDARKRGHGDREQDLERFYAK